VSGSGPYVTIVRRRPDHRRVDAGVILPPVVTFGVARTEGARH
jgi:hypothetical protein